MTVLQEHYDIVEYSELTAEDLSRQAAEFQVMLTNGEGTVTREPIASLPVRRWSRQYPKAGECITLSSRHC
ncbi:hypothetical protein [Pantoea sp. BAV 3049]|uniref:hypothetical protein n=1 Tax=Pantoea sp. BAV 3049 TaxID=2654188 RepID=UPI00131D751C|nr:hypothetical protein [Pantoea sp. BAV 3049]